MSFLVNYYQELLLRIGINMDTKAVRFIYPDRFGDDMRRDCLKTANENHENHAKKQETLKLFFPF